MVSTMTYQASQYGSKVKLIQTNANDDASKQMSDAEDLISEKVDALIIAPAVTGALAPVIGKAHAAGIPLVVSDRDIGSTGFDAFCYTSGVPIGQDVGNYAVANFTGPTNVAYITGVAGSGPDNERTEGLNDALKGHTNFHIVAQQAGNWDDATSMTVMENILQANKNLQLVITSDGSTAVGALRAIDAANRQNEIKVLSMDASRNDAYKALQDGQIMDYTAINPIYEGGWSLKVAYDLLNGGKVITDDKICAVPTAIVTKANLSKYYDPSLGDTAYTWKALYTDQLAANYSKEVQVAS
jgi:ribose transport system substrate-binding protein